MNRLFDGKQIKDGSVSYVKLDDSVYNSVKDKLTDDGFIKDDSNLVTLDGDQAITGIKTFHDLIAIRTSEDTSPTINFYRDGSATATGYIINRDAGFEISGSVIPAANGSLNLGTPDLRWSLGYISEIFTGTRTANNDTNSGVIIQSNGNLIMSSDSIPTIYFQPNNSGKLTNYISGYDFAIAVTNNFIPTTGGTLNLGNTTNRWNHLYLENNLYTNNSLLTGGRTAIQDGVTGIVVGDNGNIYMNSGFNYSAIYFQPNNSTALTQYVAAYADSTIRVSAVAFIPAVDESINLGIPGIKWNGIYTSTLYTGSKANSEDGLTGSMLTANGNLVLNSGSAPMLYFQPRNATTFTNYISANATGNALVSSNHWLPSNTGTLNLGTSSYRWGTLYSNNIDVNGAINGATITSSGDGTRYLADDGTYKAVLSPEEIEALKNEINLLKEEIASLRS